ncbi:hypothetical protein [Parabacteroides sp. Marseille-P3160]|uniref:hypothetical protein n=1 Tax=Parabacteroides sp. Marseille-P3160 TaxID=1917887 RepID=UPI0009BC12C5|nr:hypothetical protein [Parabacteroides sp. Marseille-P3160]
MKKSFLFVFFNLAVCFLAAKDYHFQTLGSLQGLSQSSAISIWQDGWGRIWLGNDALNCYDGVNVKVYKLSEYFREVIDADIHAFCGTDSLLYFLAEDKLLYFNLITEQFVLTGIQTDVICSEGGELYYANKNVLY